MHVEILVGAEPSTEGHVGLGAGKVAIAEQRGAISGRVHRVVGLVRACRRPGELSGDDRAITRIVALGMQVAELVDPGEGRVGVRVVHDTGPLEVSYRLDLEVEIQRAPRQLTLGVVEVPVDRSGVDDRNSSGRCRLAHRLSGIQEVSVEANLDPRIIHHALGPGAVSVDGDALIPITEVAVVVVEAQGQPCDHGRRQVTRVRLPLFGRVVADERLVERAPQQTDGARLQTACALRVGGAGLLTDQRPSLLGAERGAEELVDRGQVDRHGEDLAVVHGPHPVPVCGEPRESVGVPPYSLVRGVEDVRAVAMDLDACLGLHLAVAVAADHRASIDDEHPPAVLDGHAFGDGQAEQAGADDDQVDIHQRTTARIACSRRRNPLSRRKSGYSLINSRNRRLHSA